MDKETLSRYAVVTHSESGLEDPLKVVLSKAILRKP